MICGEDILNPVGGRGVYLKLVSQKMASYADIVIITPTAYGTREGFFICDEKESIRVPQEDWKPEHGKFRVFKAFFYNDYPQLDDKTIMEFDGKKVAFEGHGRVMFEEFKAYYNFMLNFASHMKKMEFDLIHVHDSDLWFLAQTLGIYYRVPIVYSSHLAENLGPSKIYMSPHWRLCITREAFALKDSIKIHTLSEDYKNKLVEVFPTIEDKITVIPNAVNGKFLDSIKFDDELRKERLGNYKGIITLVGRLVPQKGIDFFLDAVRKFPDYKFILISVYSFTHDTGTNEIAEYAKKTLDECPNFEWENGYNQDLKWKIMKISDVGVVPSRYGSYEIVVAEWMALKTPVIISNKCPIIEYLPEDCCDIIDPSSESLIETLENFEKSEDRIERAFEFAINNTWETVAKKHVEMYEKVLGEKNGWIFYPTWDRCNVPGKSIR
ncbi:MAG: glycosyltransferase [Candidatus Lokiarchaeota archaeon]|nr:glycosyltransferase [Candidatus Lokiarchaeota archaeon]